VINYRFHDGWSVIGFVKQRVDIDWFPSRVLGDVCGLELADVHDWVHSSFLETLGDLQVVGVVLEGSQDLQVEWAEPAQGELILKSLEVIGFEVYHVTGNELGGAAAGAAAGVLVLTNLLEGGVDDGVHLREKLHEFVGSGMPCALVLKELGCKRKFRLVPQVNFESSFFEAASGRRVEVELHQGDEAFPIIVLGIDEGAQKLVCPAEHALLEAIRLGMICCGH
jgi:hypothetical protein